MVQNTTKRLENLYLKANRFANFGEVITSIDIVGFRGINSLKINIDFPIVAFCGANGVGKSTILQLLACAYRKGTIAKRFYIKDFFPKGPLDPTVVSNSSKVKFKYENSEVETSLMMKTQWTGYQSQPNRNTFYLGFALFIPKIEKKDFMISYSSSLNISTSTAFSLPARQAMGQIVGLTYDNASIKEVNHKKYSGEVGTMEVPDLQYSEAHMGFGEGRLFYMIKAMEEAPNQSLFILEEPETSLHPGAQSRLAKYLLEIVERKRHQIIISTHSIALLEGLPAVARKFLWKSKSKDIEIIDGVSPQQANCFLTDFSQKALKILVEDKAAKAILTAIIRSENPSLLSQISIDHVGNDDAVRRSVEILRKLKYNTIGFRDGDKGPNAKESLFSLPGNSPPEIEIIESSSVVKNIQNAYNFDMSAHFHLYPLADHHNLFSVIAEKTHTLEDAILQECSKYYVIGLEQSTKSQILSTISEALSYKKAS